jgi:hypothetical protein
MIKSDKSDLFFNQFLKWKNNEQNSLKEKLKSFILFSKVLQASKLIKASVMLILFVKILCSCFVRALVIVPFECPYILELTP